jgi:hypothetical protein
MGDANSQDQRNWTGFAIAALRSGKYDMRQYPGPQRLAGPTVTLPDAAFWSSTPERKADHDRFVNEARGYVWDYHSSGLKLPSLSDIKNKIEDVYGTVTNPQRLLDKVPGVGALTKYIPSTPNPAQMAGNLVGAAANGDLKKLEHSAIDIGHQFADSVTVIPGAGLLVGPVNAGLELIESGSPIKAALQLLLSQVPGIPSEIRAIFRTILDGVADVIEGARAVTDVFVAEFKQGISDQVKKTGAPDPIPKMASDLADAVIQLIARYKPFEHTATHVAQKGLETAAKHGHSDPKLQQAVADLESVSLATNAIYLITQEIIRLNKQDPQKHNPNVQKQIQDLKAEIEKQKAAALAHTGQVNTAFGKPEPPHLASPKWVRAVQVLEVPVKPPQPHAPPAPHELPPTAPTAPQPHVPPPAATHTGPVYGPYPQPAGATHGVGASEAWRYFMLLADNNPVAQQGPLWLSSEDAERTAADFLEASQGRGYIGSVVRWDWDPSSNRWHRTDGSVGAPPHPHGHGPHHGRPHGHPFNFRRSGGPGWWWDVPWSSEVVTTTETCSTWGDPIEMPPAMQTAAKVALSASQGRPTTVRGPDNVLYLFAYENGAMTARPCVAVATSA